MISLENDTPLDFFIPSNEFKSMTLDRFCVKRHFEIGLVNTLTTEDEPFLNNLMSLNKIKENITHVTFIEATKVEKFMKAALSDTQEYLFPPFLLEELKEFTQFHENSYSQDPEMLDEYEAYCIKFKLIQTMYEQFSEEVKERRRQELLSKELTVLADKRPIGSRGKKGNIEARSKQSTATNRRKSRERAHEADCLEIGIMENDLVVDDVLKDQVYFYVLKGYDNILLVKELSKMQVKISFIIQISEFEPDEEKIFIKFWKDIDIVRTFPSDYLQNVALMKYQPPPQDDSSLSLEAHLSEIVNIIKSLIDLKRMHFNYVKELLLFDTKFTEIFKKFPTYDDLMRNYPLETINIPLIIDAILREVQMKSDKNSKSLNNHTKPLSRKKEPCPFDLTPKVERSQEKKVQKKTPFFKIYEKDNLHLTFKSYEVGYQYVKKSLKVLKLQLPVVLVKQCEFNNTLDDYSPHAHHVCIPSNNQAIFTNEQTDYLINLLYLKNSIIRKHTQEKIKGNEFTKNLIIHDAEKYLENSLPEYVRESGMVFDLNNDSNVYEAIQPMSLHWAEILQPELLYQYLLDAQLKYLRSDYINCELTNSLMIRFHNNVNSFGLHTKVWTEYLRTPVGLGDFCKFVLIGDYEWLKEHMPFPQVTYVDVVRMLEEKTSTRLFNDASYEAYRHLLMPPIQYSSMDIRKYINCPCIEDGESKNIGTNVGIDSIDQSVISTNLLDILHDLEEYKKLVDFSERCYRERYQPYSFSAYNLGQTKFSILGHTTNFISLDNVTITVDSSRLCTESLNLTLKLLSDDNLLVLRTKQENFYFHIVLADGTIIVISKPSFIEERSTDDTSSSLIQFEESTNDVGPSISNSESSHRSLESKQEQEEQKLIAMDFNHYSSLELYPIVGNIIRETPEELYKRDLEKEMDILKRLQNMPNCIKVSRRRNLEHLDQIVTENAIPISNVVRRIINNPTKQLLCNMPKRKCLITGELPPKKQNSSFDYTTTLPNGLTIKVQPSEILPNSSVIKQSYEYAAGPENVSEEKYRIFTSNGDIIIRKFDGTMKILTSCGKEIRFYKLSNTNGDENNCKSHKKLDDKLIRKLLARLMSNHPDQEDSDLYPSRRGHIHSKSKVVLNCPNFFQLSDLPFSVISMITLDGEKITLKDKKLYKMLYSRLMSETNFLTEERRFKREDGFSSSTDRDGNHYVVFPDGTSITTTVNIAEEVVRVNEKDIMGWVLITTDFSFEHASYKPVYFENIYNIIKIRINVHQSLEVNEEGARIDMKNSSWNIKTDSINFTKNCERCNSDYKCNIFIDPLYQNKKLDQDAYLITAEDSYNKTFKADFFGNCKVFAPYIKCAINKNGCNHALLNDHQKIFCIKKDLSGMLLWNDEKATSIVRDTEDNSTIHPSCDEKNTLLYVTINKNVSTNFSERFSGKIIREIEKLKEMLPVNRPILYQTTRSLYSMIEMAQIQDLTKCLRNFFKEEKEQELTKSVSALEFLKKYTNQSQISFTNVSGDEVKSLRSSLSVHAKIMALDRKYAEFRRIMQSPIPKYFDSTLCTFIPPNISSTSKNLNQNL